MLKKEPKSEIKQFLKGSAKLVIGLELGSLLVSYGVWHYLNKSQDFRLYMHKNCNWVLEGYYKIGETISESNKQIRTKDLEQWRSTGKI